MALLLPRLLLSHLPGSYKPPVAGCSAKSLLGLSAPEFCSAAHASTATEAKELRNSKCIEVLFLCYGKIILCSVWYHSIFFITGEKTPELSEWVQIRHWCKRRISFRQNRSSVSEELTRFVTILLPNPNSIQV